MPNRHKIDELTGISLAKSFNSEWPLISPFQVTSRTGVRTPAD
jgi:hypothetical protein